MPTYSLHRITVVSRPLPDPAGGVLPDSEYPLQVGAQINHQADYPLAASWLSYVASVLADTARLKRLEAPPNLSDRAANLAQCRAQYDYVRELAEGLCHVGNALNIQLMNDPVSRVHYRAFYSGAPANSQGVAEVFAKRPSWGGNQWFQPNEQYPLVRGGREGELGSLPRLARDCFTEFYPRKDLARRHTLQFLPRVCFAISPADSMARGLPDENPLYAATIKNSVIVSMTPELHECPNVAAPPWDAEDLYFSNRCFSERLGRSFMVYDGRGVARGTELPQGFYDWRAASFDEAWATAWGTEFDDRVPLKASVPLKSYVEYLARLVEGLASRVAAANGTFDTVVQDAYAYAIWANAQTFAANGGPERALPEIIKTRADVFSQEAAGDAGLRATMEAVDVPALAGAAGALIGALACGPFAPLCAIAGAAIGGGIQFAVEAANGTLIKGRIVGHGRDDLGRYKLVLERTSLATAVRDGEASKPQLTAEDLPNPPGYTGPTPGVYGPNPLLSDLPWAVTSLKNDPRLRQKMLDIENAGRNAATFANWFAPPPTGDDLRNRLLSGSAEGGGGGALLLLALGLGIGVAVVRSRSAR